MGSTWASRLWVTATLSLITFLGFSSQIFILWPWYGHTLSLSFLQLILPFNFLLGMLYWNYYLCVTVSPGQVPADWRPDASTLQAFEVKRLTHGPRYCKTCRHYKPPRAHHCRQCKTCVLRMDHHCPWISSKCVGYHNHGHFIRFLIFVNLATSYHLLMMCYRILDFSTYYSPEPALSDILLLIFNFVLCVPVWLAVGAFSIYHLYCAATNTTTIERWEKDRVATLVRKGKIAEIKYPYDLGWLDNLKSVLGPKPWLWLWPQEMKSDGLSFPVNKKVGDAFNQYIWPPRDPANRIPARPFDSNRLKDGPFTYGNSSFNPALRPSNGDQLRKRGLGESGGSEPELGPRPYPPSSAFDQGPRHDREISGNDLEKKDETGYSSGESRDAESYTSSPVAHLSDYDNFEDDDENDTEDGPQPRGSRIRRGSEGYEIRPNYVWNSELSGDSDPEDYPGADGDVLSERQRQGWVEQGDGMGNGQPVQQMPWEDLGRYQIQEDEGNQGNQIDRQQDDTSSLQ